MTEEEEENKEKPLEEQNKKDSTPPQPTQLPLSFHKIKGLTIRKRVDPTTSSKRESYQIQRAIKYTMKGKRIYFQIKTGNNVLYTTKMKGKRPDDPLPIAKGDQMHYSSKEFAGYLLSGNKHTIFSLRAQTTFGKELLSILFESPNGDKSLPKKISVSFFLKDSLIPKKLVNLDPSINDDGFFELNFHNKHVIPSIKNCILINDENKCEFVMVRKVSDDLIEADAVNVLSPLAVFAIVLSLCQSPF